jgi:hypothetical protein
MERCVLDFDIPERGYDQELAWRLTQIQEFEGGFLQEFEIFRV